MKIIALCFLVLLCHKGQAYTGENMMVDFAKNFHKYGHVFEEHLAKAGYSTQGKQLSNAFQAEDNCETCQDIVATLKPIAEIVTFDQIRDIAVDVCLALSEDLDPGARGDIVCPGSIDRQGPHVFSVLKDSRSNEINICRSLNLCIAPTVAKNKEEMVDEGFFAPPGHLRSLRHKRNSKDIKIVHIADIHVDAKYKIGSPNDCGLMVCCREGLTGSGKAGRWGDYECNIPQRTMELFFSKVKEMQPDFVIYSGDNPPHHLWEESRETQFEGTRLVYESMQKILTGVEIYAAMGNHEPNPTNIYNTDLEDTKIILKELTTYWTKIAKLDSTAVDTISRGAYYTTLVAPGLRILTLNTNLWYIFNWYNIIKMESPSYNAMKRFMIDTLENARKNNEKVLIMYHHPVGGFDQIHTATRWIRDVLLQYADIIVLQVSGHTHRDSFKIIADDSGVAKGTLYINPSVTTEGMINPSLRVFTLDKDDYHVKDYDQYRFDITAENPAIELLYNPRSEYGLKDLSPVSWLGLVEKMKTDTEVRGKWLLNNHAGNPVPCDEVCQRNKICTIRHVLWREELACEKNTTSWNKVEKYSLSGNKANPTVFSFFTLIVSFIVYYVY